MEQKNILGLDLGTNSVGWAVVNVTQEEGVGYSIDGIKDAGCRIIPMDAERMGKFSKGDTVSQTCDRTMARGVRRLLERSHLRRERLHRVMSILGFLPEHYSVNLTRYGKSKDAVECKLAWIKDKNGSPKFLFEDSYNEMLRLFWETHPGLMKEGMKVPYDWTIYYLRCCLPCKGANFSANHNPCEYACTEAELLFTLQRCENIGKLQSQLSMFSVERLECMIF